MDDMRRNGSGYKDPTAYKAYRNIKANKAALAKRVIKTIQNVAHLAGFDIVGRITLRDVETRDEYR
jgi:hypothetical protein